MGENPQEAQQAFSRVLYTTEKSGKEHGMQQGERTGVKAGRVTRVEALPTATHTHFSFVHSQKKLFTLHKKRIAIS